MWPRRIESGVGRIESGMERIDGTLDQVLDVLGDVRDERRFANESLRRIEIVLGDQNTLTELRDHGRAQTRALLAILDRLDNGGAPARARPA